MWKRTRAYGPRWFAAGDFPRAWHGGVDNDGLHSRTFEQHVGAFYRQRSSPQHDLGMLRNAW